MKNPLTSAQHLNHCATMVPASLQIGIVNLIWKQIIQYI